MQLAEPADGPALHHQGGAAARVQQIVGSLSRRQGPVLHGHQQGIKACLEDAPGEVVIGRL
jgi:hypothetical protein